MPTATGIMYRDAYGWFGRVDRGIYALSPKGQQALETYADELERLGEDRASSSEWDAQAHGDR